MFLGRTPFNGHSEAGLLSNILNQGLHIPSSPAISENSKDFIRRCLVVDDSKRWAIRDMCSHRLVSAEIIERTPLMVLPQNEVKQRRSISF
jgi:serine/threonine protein kinase